jgi:hypothetical protein
LPPPFLSNPSSSAYGVVAESDFCFRRSEYGAGFRRVG